METQRARQIEELFRLGVEFDDEERRAFLARHCAGNEELHAELSTLLSQDDAGTRSYLESPVVAAWNKNADSSRRNSDADTCTSRSGSHAERIGRYQIVETLGEGGMGAVYLAHQEDPVSRDVALKIVKLGMDTRRVVTRFERERQALAMMDHPGIARIYDGGATENGRPYFVMEYVPGVPITEYCDGLRLPVRARLALFIQVCEAIHHAHSKGIIHRDLKPSNVLVAERDGLPLPKVIDFGIARATADADDAAERVTRASEVIGTYAYMSPEQADPAWGETDARSDVYGLGVLLYELLTGALPVDADKLSGKSPSEVSRLLRDTDPPAPSTEVSRLGSTSTHVAQRRGGLDVRTLTRRMSGDLDWITLKAMERDPERRYSSALMLANDLRRHLESRVVLAGPPDIAYRLKKFIRRNRTAVLSTAVLALTFVGGVTGTAAGFHKASQSSSQVLVAEQGTLGARDALRAAEEERIAEREQFGQVSDLLLRVVGLIDPEVAPDDMGSSSALLDDLDGGIKAAFQNDPKGEARLRLAIGRALSSRGDLVAARLQLERADMLLGRDGVQPADRREARLALGELKALETHPDRYPGQ